MEKHDGFENVGEKIKSIAVVARILMVVVAGLSLFIGICLFFDSFGDSHHDFEEYIMEPALWKTFLMICITSLLFSFLAYPLYGFGVLVECVEKIRFDTHIVEMHENQTAASVKRMETNIAEQVSLTRAFFLNQVRSNDESC